MNIEDVVHVIEKAGVNIGLRNDTLYVQGSRAETPPEVLKLIQTFKLELTNWLRAPDSSRSSLRKVSAAGGKHPLSSAQKRIWFTHKLEGSSAQYNMIYAWELEGSLNVRRLNQAIHKVVTEHPMLRTVFEQQGGSPIQSVLDSYQFRLGVVDCQDAPDDAFSEMCRDCLISEGNKSFDLSNDLLIRGTLLLRNKSYFFLVLAIHHIAADGWSEGIIKREISKNYNNPDNSKPPLERPWRYTDYVYHQTALNVERELQYWVRKLTGIDCKARPPTDKIRPKEQTFSGAILRSCVSQSSAARVMKIFSDHGVTPYVGLYTCFCLLVRHLTGRNEVVMGTPVAGRERVEFSEVVGFFVNTLVLRTELSLDETFATAFEKCSNTVIDALSNQRLPFEMLVERLQPSRSLDAHPLFQIMFAFQSNEHGRLDLRGVRATESDEVCPKVIFDLQIDVIQSDRGLELEWRYNTDLFKSTSIAKMAEAFELVLLSISEANSAVVSDLPLGAVIEDWSDVCRYQLEAHASVAQAVVTRHVLDGVDHVVAAVVPEDGGQERESEQLLEEWISLFNDVYEIEGPTYFDTRGWNSSYTGNLIPDDEMKEWVDNTIARIQSLSPRRILEIGTGTGLLLYRLMEKCEAYVGIEPSSNVVLRHNTNFKRMGIENAKLYAGCAHDVKQLGPNGVDTVVINSVAQYFPSLTYLSSVIDDALELMSIGTIFIGDVCDYCLQDEFYLSLLSHRDFNWLSDRSSSQLLEFIGRKRSVERELMVSPEFFVQLRKRHPKVTGVEVLPKRGDYPNEMTRFRYDVVIVVGRAVDKPKLTTVEWSEGWSLSRNSTDFVVAGYPNKRVFMESEVTRMLRDGSFYSTCPSEALSRARRIKSLDELYQMATDFGYYLSVQLSIETERASRSFDLIFTQRPLPLGGYDHPVARIPDSRKHGTEPSRKSLVVYHDDSELKQAMRGALPEQLQPTKYVFVSQIPLTCTGDVDWEQLLESFSVSAESFPTAETDLNGVVSVCWQDALRVDEPVGLDDNFFDIGGHSLLATRVASQLSKRFTIQLTVRDVFVAQTVRELAALVRRKLEERDEHRALVSGADDLDDGVVL